MMQYVHKDLLMEAERGENGEIILKSDRINSKVSDQEFYDNYVAVRKLRKVKTTRKSPFEVMYAEKLSNFSLDSNVEDEQYIEGTKELISNKAF